MHAFVQLSGILSVIK